MGFTNMDNVVEYLCQLEPSITPAHRAKARGIQRHIQTPVEADGQYTGRYIAIKPKGTPGFISTVDEAQV